MPDDNLGDWRIKAITTLTQDVPAAYPGGPSHKAGTPLFRASTFIKHPVHSVFGFGEPSAAALALSAAIKNAAAACHIKGTIAVVDFVTPWGSGKGVAHDNLPYLYDFFENCMVAVITSFQALEIFSNDVLSRELKGTYELKRKKSTSVLTPDELERQASTDEKVGTIVPELLNLASPRGTLVWQRYLDLKRARDATVHLKSFDATPLAVDRESLFFQFFDQDTREFPKMAFDIIEYFHASKVLPRWAQGVKEQLARI